MIHEDGIEVYLKPLGKSKVNLRFPELKLDDGNALRKRCCIPAIEEEFQVVIKFAKTFDTRSTECVNVALAGNIGATRGFSIQVTESSDVVGGRLFLYFHHTVDLGPHNFRFKAYPDTPRRSLRPQPSVFDHQLATGRLRAADGNILIFITLGGGKRVKDADPTEPNSYHFGSFHHLRGGKDHQYMFEFCPRSEVVYNEDQLEREWPFGNSVLESKADTFAFSPDPDFAGARAKSLRFWKELKAAWRHRQTLKSSQTSPGSRKHSQLAAPATCDCPVETHPRSKSRSKPIFGVSKEDHSSDMPSPSKKVDDDEETTGAAESNSTDTLDGENKRENDRIKEETPARTCRTCQQYKKPPRGKKLAWRQRTQKWMYVRQGAPDGDAPVEEQDDDEPLPSQAEDSVTLPHETATRDSSPHDATMSQETDVERITTPSAYTSEKQLLEVAPEKEIHAATEVLSADADSNSVEGPGQVLTSAAMPESTRSKKRQDINEHEAPVTKKRCVDIDLTMDEDEDEVVFVKREGADLPESKRAIDKTAEDLQYRLEQVRRRKQILELEDEEAEIMRDMADQQKKERQKSVKEEAVFKIEE